MNSPPNNPVNNAHFESVHICQRCGHILNLDAIDLRTITTGIVECPKCGWHGGIEIQISEVNGEP